MLKFIKWSLIGVITAGAASYFVLGDHFCSYFRTIGSSIRESVKDNISVDFEIKRAEKLIHAIEPEINECKREVARAEVELDHLIRDVKRLESTVEKQERKLRSGSELLDAKTSSFEIGGRDYTRRRVEIDLARTFEMYKNNKAMLQSKKSLIERQTMAVAASRVKLDSVRSRKAELENTIASLKVQKQHLDALAASSRRFDLDDSALSQATEVLADVKKRLDVTQKMIESDMFFADGITDEKVPSRDIVKEIHQHFATEDAPRKGLTARHAHPLEIGR